jgi:hypothetical protein
MGQAYEYAIGVDLGQKQDHTAVAVLEKLRTQYYERDPYTADYLTRTECRVVKIERLPLGMAYPDVVEHVRALAVRAGDVTGISWPRQPPRLQQFHHRPAHARAVHHHWHPPPVDLITGLQVAFETRQLVLDAGLRGLDALLSELMSMRVAVSASGHERFEAWREGAHDDLVLALAPAWWQVARRDPELRKMRGW